MSGDFQPQGGSIQRHEHSVAASTAQTGLVGQSGKPSEGHSARKRIRILLVDPRPLTAKAIKGFLEASRDQDDSDQFDVDVATTNRRPAADSEFDLLLLHVSCSGDMSIEIERALCAVPAPRHKVPMVVFSDCEGADAIAAAIRAGACGYLPSTLESGEILTALRLLASGLAVLPAAALSHLHVARHTEIRPDDGRMPQFTAREYEVLSGLHEGKPNKVIARELDLSESTVKVHVCSIFRKLGVQNRTEAAVVAGHCVSDEMA